MKNQFLIIAGVVLMAFSCQETPKAKRFNLLSEGQSGIDFNNILTENDTFNYFTYSYMYMGGGISVGDINQDGLPDLFFTGNQVQNKLYLNKGGLKFEDITEKSGVAGDDRWYTGTSMVDINSDGLLDIYVCVSGKYDQRENQLFVNNGDLTFTESAAQYGLADNSQSIQASFFDYDKDGDLDMYLAHYPSTPFNTSQNEYRNWIDNPSKETSDRLYRQDDNGKFIDVTEKSGLLNFGLTVSASIADFNNDGWEDIYVSNDFSTPDFFYFNNGDGTFTDKLKDVTKQTAFYGMGTDAADFNNDGLFDLMQVDMAAQDNRRQKANMASMNPKLFWNTVNNGFHYQYMYNALQLNRGISDNLPLFSNTAWISNVAATDWSWCPLFADFDNDGLKDLFVTNGTRKEINNRDFFKALDKLTIQQRIDSAYHLSMQMPQEPIDNFIFKNRDGMIFDKMNEDWSLELVGFSNGAVYSDLDGDGDLDLIINNIDDPSVIFENNSNEIDQSQFVKIELRGDEKNPFGLSSLVSLNTSSGSQHRYMTSSRGYQSSIDPVLHFGIAPGTEILDVKIQWSDGTVQLVSDLMINQLNTIKKQANSAPQSEKNQDTFFTDQNEKLPEFYHSENPYNDFIHQVLLPHKMSNFGPALATGDINGDQLDDIFVGNGADHPAQFFLQNSDGNFDIFMEPTLRLDSAQEDMGALFFDVDLDGDLDLYVVSGGNKELDYKKDFYQDRLYLNDGKGSFQKTENVLPDVIGSGSRVIAKDIDGDNDLDLMVAGRLYPQKYPDPGQSYILINKLETGTLVFEDATASLIPEFSRLGMVTDMTWVDLDNNGKEEFVVVGEWMPLTVFEEMNGTFQLATEKYGFSDTFGWWFSVDKGDFDNDGDMDLIAGNLGLNYKYQANENETFDLYVNDFDKNTKNDLVLGYFNNGEQFPVRGRQCSSDQVPAIQEKYKDYSSFSTATLEDIYGKRDLENSVHFQVKSFASVYVENKGNGEMALQPLPTLAQISPINDMIIDDVNGDNNLDVIVAGNLYAAEVETPRSDAGTGLLLLGNGKGRFTSSPINESGIVLNDDVKNLAPIQAGDKKGFVSASNQGKLQILIESDD
ncbi:MAG: VCBS repeat-containing protein [Cyclobacteriaceae bacterium]